MEGGRLKGGRLIEVLLYISQGKDGIVAWKKMPLFTKAESIH